MDGLYVVNDRLTIERKDANVTLTFRAEEPKAAERLFAVLRDGLETGAPVFLRLDRKGTALMAVPQ